MCNIDIYIQIDRYNVEGCSGWLGCGSKICKFALGSLVSDHSASVAGAAKICGGSRISRARAVEGSFESRHRFYFRMVQNDG